MTFTQWVDTPQEWSELPNLQWIPQEDGPGVIYPLKNFITNTKVPYYFITENREHIFETNRSKFKFEIKDNIYQFISIDDKNRKIT